MDLNGGGVGLVPISADEKPDMERLLSIMIQMQEGQNRLTEILIQQKADIDALKIEQRRLKARTDAPKRSLVMAGDAKWPN